MLHPLLCHLIFTSKDTKALRDHHKLGQRRSFQLFSAQERRPCCCHRHQEPRVIVESALGETPGDAFMEHDRTEPSVLPYRVKRLP